MKHCLYCGRILDEPRMHGWHQRCIRSFFGTKEMPILDIDEANLGLHATQSGYTVPGVQKKLSLSLNHTKQTDRLTLVGKPPGYIVKLQTEAYEALPELEHVAMHMAKIAKIATVPNALIQLHDGSLAYIAKRIDRIFKKDCVIQIPMEDFCQLTGRLTEDKYQGSYEQCATIIRTYSRQHMLDLTNFWYVLVFCFITGNSDMHLKNFSLYAPVNEHFQLTPAYDLLPVQLIPPEDTQEMALTLRGKKSRLKRADFLGLAKHLEIPEQVAIRLIKRVSGLFPQWEALISESCMPNHLKPALTELVKTRIDRITTE
nr:HipA domain-containing protein [uncultured Sphaerochaeta sp.]